MTSVSKVLVATALLASFAAPAFAATLNIESRTVEERNVYTNPPASVWTRSNNGTQAYAMAPRDERAPVTSVSEFNQSANK